MDTFPCSEANGSSLDGSTGINSRQTIDRMGSCPRILRSGRWRTLLLAVVLSCTASSCRDCEDSTGPNLHQYHDLSSALQNPLDVYYLHLIDQDLNSLPDGIGALVHLRLLVCINCRLSSLPSTLVNLQELYELRMINGQFESIPPFVSQIPNLSILSFSHNRIRAIPISIASCPRLEVLDVSSNQLDSVHTQLFGIPTLNSLILDSNRITALPATIPSTCAITILSLVGNPLPPAEKARIQAMLPNTRIYF